jgi:hypothetical protein
MDHFLKGIAELQISANIFIAISKGERAIAISPSRTIATLTRW